MSAVVAFEKPKDNIITIGRSKTAAMHLDVQKLIDTRMLIQANSGGGKSSLMRLIVERAAGKVPFIILDWEGEFSSLREKLDVVLVGSDGEIATDVHSAKLLARKLIELHASAVIDLSDLETAKRREYVQHFLDSLIILPRSLWHTTMVCIDEAHQVCPEAGKVESAQAVINLMSLGRKRGLCGILSTQRLSKLHKDAASECNNVFIGRTVLDNDQQRAGDVLGMNKADRLGLRDLAEGEFHAFGSAVLFKGVQRFQADLPETKAPKAGERHHLTVPKASDVISHIVSKLADLPQQAEEEIKSLEDAKRRISELEKAAKSGNAFPTSQADYERLRKLRDEAESKYQKLLDQVELLKEQNSGLLAKLNEINRLSNTDGAERVQIQPPRHSILRAPNIVKPVAKELPKVIPTNKANASDLKGGERTILTAIAQSNGNSTREQLTVLTGYKRSSRDAYIQRLRQQGYVDASGDRLRATEAGLVALGDFEPLPTGEGLQNYWLARLPEGERRILEVVIQYYPGTVEREKISDLTEYKRSSRDAYIQRLTARQLLEGVGRGEVRASRNLFD